MRQQQPLARVALLIAGVLAVIAAVLASSWLGSMDPTVGAACGDQVSYGECLLASRMNRAVTHLLGALTFATGGGAATALLVAIVSLARTRPARSG